MLIGFVALWGSSLNGFAPLWGLSLIVGMSHFWVCHILGFVTNWVCLIMGFLAYWVFRETLLIKLLLILQWLFIFGYRLQQKYILSKSLSKQPKILNLKKKYFIFIYIRLKLPLGVWLSQIYIATSSLHNTVKKIEGNSSSKTFFIC